MLINPGDTILVNEPLFPGTLYAVSTYFTKREIFTALWNACHLKDLFKRQVLLSSFAARLSGVMCLKLVWFISFCSHLVPNLFLTVELTFTTINRMLEFV